MSSLLATGMKNDALFGLFRGDKGANRVDARRSQQDIPARRRHHAGSATGGGGGDPAVLLQHQIFGRDVVFVGDDASLQRELLRSLEGIGGRDEIGGEAACEEVARRTGGEEREPILNRERELAFSASRQ